MYIKDGKDAAGTDHSGGCRAVAIPSMLGGCSMLHCMMLIPRANHSGIYVPCHYTHLGSELSMQLIFS